MNCRAALKVMFRRFFSTLIRLPLNPTNEWHKPSTSIVRVPPAPHRSRHRLPNIRPYEPFLIGFFTRAFRFFTVASSMDADLASPFQHSSPRDQASKARSECTQITPSTWQADCNEFVSEASSWLQLRRLKMRVRPFEVLAALSLALFLSISTQPSAANDRSSSPERAVPGTLNYVEGSVSINSEAMTAKSIGAAQLDN